MHQTIYADHLIPQGQQHVVSIQNHHNDYEFRFHGHLGYCEWTLIQRGELSQRTGSVVTKYHTGDLILIPENVKHGLRSSGLNFANMPVRTPFMIQMAQACGAMELANDLSMSHTAMARRLTEEEFHLANAYFLKARREPHRVATSAHVVAGFLDFITRESISNLPPKWLSDQLSVVDKQLEDGLTVNALPTLFHRSAAHISRTIKELYGCTPSTWLNQRRATRAAELLLNTERELVDISIALSFSSQSHFTRCFREVFGQSPGRYRRSNGQAGV